MTSPDHAKGLGAVKSGSARDKSYGLFSGIDNIPVFMLEHEA
jgi:hypothetical protein